VINGVAAFDLSKVNAAGDVSMHGLMGALLFASGSFVRNRPSA
jgi:hypothetical protein